MTKRFETEFAAAVGAKYAIALNSCTAALHLAVEALGLKAGQGVLVPTMTFAATAEIVRYLGAVPILVDCDYATGNLDLNDAERKLADLRSGKLPPALDRDLPVVGLIPVHFAGLMLNMAEVSEFAQRHGLWVVEDAAHAFPAAWRPHENAPWQRCGENSSAATCFSFYANKTITTGEGGMAVTDDQALADRMRMMSLHGLSHDAWGRYSGGSWDYRIVAPGYKYNLTDIASALGVQQLARAEDLRRQRSDLVTAYRTLLADADYLELPGNPSNRIHAWHLFPIRLHLNRIPRDRNAVISGLKERGIGSSVHWRPLHLHPYYQQTFGWQPASLPTATALFDRILTLPMFPGMTAAEQQAVVGNLRDLCR